jgi:hypothetical protein
MVSAFQTENRHGIRNYARLVSVQAGDTERFSLFPPPEITFRPLRTLSESSYSLRPTPRPASTVRVRLQLTQSTLSNAEVHRT